MLEPELSGLLNSIPRAINDTDAVFLSILKVLKGALFFAECWKDYSLEFFLFVKGGKQFKPFEFFARTLFGITMGKVNHEQLDSLLRLLDFFPLCVCFLLRVELTLLVERLLTKLLFLILLIFLIIVIIILFLSLIFGFRLLYVHFLVQFFLYWLLIMLAFAIVILCLLVNLFMLSLHRLTHWFTFFSFYKLDQLYWYSLF